jgi:hypothetical protein
LQSTQQLAAVAPLAASAPQTVTALPEVVNLEFYQGDDFYLDVTVNDGSGSPAVLTGSSPRAEIHAAPGDPVPLATFTITIDAAPGLLHLHLPAAESADVPATAVWDLQLSAPDVTTLAAGTVACTQQVTV